MNDTLIDFHHAGVSVPDLEAAIAWYEEVLEFKLERRIAIPQVGARAAFVRKGALRFEIFEVTDAAPLPDERRFPQLDLRTHGNKHVAFQVEDLETFLVAMQARGADVALVVREAFGKGCFVRDCAGNLIEFVERSSG